MKALLSILILSASAWAGEGGVGTTGGGDFSVTIEGWRTHLPADVEVYSVADIISRPARGQRWWQGVARECRTLGGRPGVFGLTRVEERTNAQYIELRFRGLRPVAGEPVLTFEAHGISEGERTEVGAAYPFENCLEGGRDHQVYWDGSVLSVAELRRRLEALRSLAESSVHLETPAEWVLLVEHDRWAVPLARTARLPVVRLVDRALERVLEDARTRSRTVTRLAEQSVGASGQCREGPFLEIRRVMREWNLGSRLFFRQLEEQAGIQSTHPLAVEAMNLRSDAQDFVDQEVYRQCEAFMLYAVRSEHIDTLLADVSTLDSAYEEMRELRDAHPDPRIRASMRERLAQWNTLYLSRLFESLASRLALVPSASGLTAHRPRFESFSREWANLLGRAAPGAVDLGSGTVAIDPLLFPPATMRLFLLHELIHLNDRCAAGGCTDQEMEVRAWRQTFQVMNLWAEVTHEAVPELFQTLQQQGRESGLEAWVRGILASR